MNIGLDMMGGDFAPLEAVRGLKHFLSVNTSAANIFCIGDEALVLPLLEEHQVASPLLHLVHAPEVIGYHEHPTKALKEKQKSSISIGYHLLATGKIDAFISAGNTGAMLVGAMFIIKPIEGVLRPCVSGVVPKSNGETGVILDVGLNADCKPELLNQFAVLGSLYAQHILKVSNPKVGLLNVGEEEGKGNILCQATFPLLKENAQINFIGNIEGRDIFTEKTDVIVCDGFTGNIILKMAESVYDLAALRNFDQDTYFNRFHYENYGGSPVLGVAKPVVLGHGISSDKAFSNMLDLAVQMVQSDICSKMADSFKAIN